MRVFPWTIVLALWPSVAPGQAWQGSAGPIAYLSRRAAVFDDAVGKGRATMGGAELTFRRSRLGIVARVSGARFTGDSGSGGTGRISQGVLGLLVGPETASLDVGYGRRALSGALAGRTWSFIRVGAKSELPIGGSGLAAQLALGWYLGFSGSGDFTRGSGGDVETRLSFALPRVPIALVLGYRLERLKIEAGGEQRPEEVSAVLIGGVVRFGPQQPAAR